MFSVYKRMDLFQLLPSEVKTEDSAYLKRVCQASSDVVPGFCFGFLCFFFFTVSRT